MFNKIYEGIKNFIKNNIGFVITLIVMVILVTVKLPYEVEMPGGIIDLSDRITVDGKDADIEGSFNMAYVSVVQGSIPYVLLGTILPDWDVIKVSDVTYDNETIEDANKRDRVYLEQSKNYAIISALEAANIDYKINNKVNSVIYITKEANTDLKIGDNVIKCEGIEVSDVAEIKKVVAEKNVGDTVTFTVSRDGKEVLKKAKIYEEDGEKYAGVSVVTTFDIESSKDIQIKTKLSESGPSGGMMMALMIYNALTEQDLTHGKKIVGTGTISVDGTVGEIGGIKYKVMGAVKNKADVILVPKENYDEAMEVKKAKKYVIEIVKVEKLQDAIDYLEGI